MVNGEAQPYVFYTYELSSLVTCSYEEARIRIEAYSRALVKYDLLSTTQGYEKQTDGTPVGFQGVAQTPDPHHRSLHEELDASPPVAVRRVAYQRHGGSSLRHARRGGHRVIACPFSHSQPRVQRGRNQDRSLQSRVGGASPPQHGRPQRQVLRFEEHRHRRRLSPL